MSTKLNIALLMFGFIMQSLFFGLLLLLPANMLASMPAYANPMLIINPSCVSSADCSYGSTCVYDAPLNSTRCEPAYNFGLAMSPTSTCAATTSYCECSEAYCATPGVSCSDKYCDCSAGTLYLGCLGKAMKGFFSFITNLQNVLNMAVNLAFYILKIVYVMVVYFLASGYIIISAFPAWLSIPLGLFVVLINVLVAIDIILVIKGLIENII